MKRSWIYGTLSLGTLLGGMLILPTGEPNAYVGFGLAWMSGILAEAADRNSKKEKGL